MAKRRLSEQQKRRIEKNKTQHLDPTATEQLSSEKLNGIVVRHYGREVIVETEATTDAKQVTCKLRQNLGDIACGDRVIYQLEEDSQQGVVIAIDERDNLLLKTGFAGKAKPVAANLGQVIIVCSVEPPPNSYLVDRYLVATENLNARALLVLNKIDLDDENHHELINQFDRLYHHIGYTVLHASASTGLGMDKLKQQLDNTTSIFVGLSGVGKSSLVNQLIPDLDVRVGEVSESTGEGRHTTTVSSLYHLECGGNLIDSPGVRDFTPWQPSKNDILNGFVELRQYRGKCKFANCTHLHEPDCAILQAVKDGDVSQQRFDSYQHMLSDMSEQ